MVVKKVGNTSWRILGGLSSLFFGSLIVTGIIIIISVAGV